MRNCKPHIMSFPKTNLKKNEIKENHFFLKIKENENCMVLEKI